MVRREDDERRRVWIAFGLALVAVTIFRVLAVDALGDRSFFLKYIEFADALRAGNIAHDRIPDLSPGYLWTIALLRAIGLGVHGIRTLQIILVSAIAAIAARIAYRSSGTVAAIAAAVLVLGSKAALVNATDLEPETFLLLFSAAGRDFDPNGASRHVGRRVRSCRGVSAGRASGGDRTPRMDRRSPRPRVGVPHRTDRSGRRGARRQSRDDRKSAADGSRHGVL